MRNKLINLNKIISKHLLIKACWFLILFSVAAYSDNLAVEQKLDPYIQNLSSRFSEAKIKGGGQLVLSYQGLNSCYLYDQALAILAFVHADQRKAAEKILLGLSHLQSSRGTWAFSYEAVHGRIIPGDDQISPTGAIAWMAIAIEAYQNKYGSFSDFDLMLDNTLDYLASLQTEIQWNGTNYFPLIFSPTRPRTVSFEHNADAYAAFMNAANADRQHAKKYAKTLVDLKIFLEALWKNKRFQTGFNITQGKPDEEELYLDTQFIGYLVLNANNKEKDYTQGLYTNCKEFKKLNPINGFVAYRLRGNPPSSSLPVWSEGSLGMMLAMKIAKMDDCENSSLRMFESAIDSITQTDYGVPYATASNDPDFSTASSVAGTAWKYFYLKEFNPYYPTLA